MADAALARAFDAVRDVVRAKDEEIEELQTKVRRLERSQKLLEKEKELLENQKRARDAEDAIKELEAARRASGEHKSTLALTDEPPPPPPPSIPSSGPESAAIVRRPSKLEGGFLVLEEIMTRTDAMVRDALNSDAFTRNADAREIRTPTKTMMNDALKHADEQKREACMKLLAFADRRRNATTDTTTRFGSRSPRSGFNMEVSPMSSPISPGRRRRLREEASMDLTFLDDAKKALEELKATRQLAELQIKFLKWKDVHWIPPARASAPPPAVSLKATEEPVGRDSLVRNPKTRLSGSVDLSILDEVNTFMKEFQETSEHLLDVKPSSTHAPAVRPKETVEDFELMLAELDRKFSEALTQNGPELQELREKVADLETVSQKVLAASANIREEVHETKASTRKARLSGSPDLSIVSAEKTKARLLGPASSPPPAAEEPVRRDSLVRTPEGRLSGSVDRSDLNEFRAFLEEHQQTNAHLLDVKCGIREDGVDEPAPAPAAVKPAPAAEEEKEPAGPRRSTRKRSQATKFY